MIIQHRNLECGAAMTLSPPDASVCQLGPLEMCEHRVHCVFTNPPDWTGKPTTYEVLGGVTPSSHPLRRGDVPNPALMEGTVKIASELHLYHSRKTARPVNVSSQTMGPRTRGHGMSKKSRVEKVGRMTRSVIRTAEDRPVRETVKSESVPLSHCDRFGQQFCIESA